MKARLRRMSEADAASALSEFPNLGIDAHRSLAEDRRVYDLDDQLFTLVPTTDWILLSRDIYVPVSDAAFLNDIDTLNNLCAAVQRNWPKADRLLIRVPDALETGPPNWQLHSSYVTREADSVPPDDNAEVRVRPIDEKSRPFVLGLLEMALVGGYRNLGIEPDTERIHRLVRRDYRDLGISDKDGAFVASVDDVAVGHGTWKRDSQDDVTGSVFSEIEDIFVIPEYAGRGLSRTILSAIAKAFPGTVLLGNISGGPEAIWRHVRDGLVRGGWTVEFEIWSAKLAYG